MAAKDKKRKGSSLFAVAVTKQGKLTQPCSVSASCHSRRLGGLYRLFQATILVYIASSIIVQQRYLKTESVINGKLQFLGSCVCSTIASDTNLTRCCTNDFRCSQSNIEGTFGRDQQLRLLQISSTTMSILERERHPLRARRRRRTNHYTSTDQGVRTIQQFNISRQESLRCQYPHYRWM